MIFYYVRHGDPIYDPTASPNWGMNRQKLCQNVLVYMVWMKYMLPRPCAHK